MDRVKKRGNINQTPTLRAKNNTWYVTINSQRKSTSRENAEAIRTTANIFRGGEGKKPVITACPEG